MKKYTVDELKKIFKESPYSSGHTMQFLKWLDHLSEEKDQYGHKIIRPTIPDNAFDELEYDRIAKELKETTATPKQEEWEEKIYDLLSTTEPLGKGFKIIKTDAGTANEIIDLIRQLLKEERGRVIEEIDSWLKKDSEGTWELEGLYMRFKDYLRKLKK